MDGTQTGGSIWGEAKNPQLLPAKTRMVKNIIRSSWPAATEADPNDSDAKPFVWSVPSLLIKE
jgi:hypothetical protein